MTLTMAVAGTVAAATTAKAETISIAPVKPCYLTGEEVTATGAGFTAGGPVDFAIDGTSIGQLPAADAAGGFGIPVTFGTMRGVKSHALTATDTTNPALKATESFLGTSNTVTVKPKRATAGARMRLKGYGFLEGSRVYMHVRKRGYKSDSRLARAKAPCGTFQVRRKIVPVGARSGTYKVQFDQKRRYSAQTEPSVRGTLTVFRTAGSSSARAAFASP
jgi:hypothetical protein